MCLRTRVAELEVALTEAWRNAALELQLSESLKMALRMPGTGSYVEFAKECRAALDNPKNLPFVGKS